MGSGYVHGDSAREQRRLHDQASMLTELLHADSRFPEGSPVLEAGCGVGSQTGTPAARNPTCRYRTAEADGVFCHTFFKAFATWGG